jgi:hypothetical protein
VRKGANCSENDDAKTDALVRVIILTIINKSNVGLWSSPIQFESRN